jgi:hypothetical protein
MAIGPTLPAGRLSRRGWSGQLGVLHAQVEVTLAQGDQPFDGVAAPDADRGAHVGGSRLADKHVILQLPADVRPTQSAFHDVRRHWRVALKRNQGHSRVCHAGCGPPL